MSAALQTLGDTQAAELGKKLGLEAPVTEALRSPAFVAQADASYASLEGSRVEAAGERAHQVMASVREVGRQMDSVFAQAFLTMADKLEPFLQNVGIWLKENGTTLGTRLGEVGNFAISILSGLGPLISMFQTLDEVTGGFSSQALLATGPYWGGGAVIGAVQSAVVIVASLRADRTPGKAVDAVERRLGSRHEQCEKIHRFRPCPRGNFLASSGRAAVIRLGEFAANAWGRLGGFATQAGTSVMNGLNTAGSAVAKGAEKASSWLGRAAASVGEASGPALRIGARVGGNLALMLMPSELGDDQLELKKLQYRRANGLPLDGSADPDQDGLDGSVMQYYVKPDGPEPARTAPYPSSPTADRLSRMLNPASIEPWQGYAPGFAGTGLLGLPGMPPSQPGVTSATVNANTTINVHGVSDPLAVGNAVANEQNRVNSDLARNTRGAME